MPRYRTTANGNIPFTAEEEAQRDAEEFAAAKIQKAEEMKRAYENAITENIVHDNKTWAAAKNDQMLLATVLAVGSVPVGMYWRDAAGTKHDMDFTALQALAGAMLARGLTADTNLQNKLDAVEAATTINELNAITW